MDHELEERRLSEVEEEPIQTPPLDEDSPKTNQRLTPRLLAVVTLVTLGTWYPFGFSLTAMNGTQAIIVKWIRSIKCERLETNSSQTSLWCDEIAQEKMLVENLELNIIWALSSSMLNLGGLISTPMSHVFVKKFGLKSTFYFYSIVISLGTVVFCLAQLTSIFELLIIGRFVIGFALGIIMVITPMYNTELTPVKLRGSIGTFPVVIFVMALIIATALALPHVMGNERSWSWLVATNLIPVFIMSVGLPFCPESPRRLFITQGEKISAEKVLIWLRQTSNVGDELEAMQKEVDEQKSRKTHMTISRFVRSPFLRSVFMICAVPMLINQFSGFSCLSFYSTSIFISVGLSKVQAIYASIGLWVTFLLGGLTSMMLVDRAGRRKMLLVSHFIMALSLIFFVSFQVVARHWYPPMKFGSAVCIFLCVIGIATGSASIPWLLPAEMFAQDARGVAMGLNTVVNRASALISTMVFPLIVTQLEEYTFIIFIVFIVGATIYIFIRLPETKGKNIYEIQKLLRQSIR